MTTNMERISANNELNPSVMMGLRNTPFRSRNILAKRQGKDDKGASYDEHVNDLCEESYGTRIRDELYSDV